MAVSITHLVPNFDITRVECIKTFVVPTVHKRRVTFLHSAARVRNLRYILASHDVCAVHGTSFFTGFLHVLTLTAPRLLIARVYFVGYQFKDPLRTWPQWSSTKIPRLARTTLTLLEEESDIQAYHQFSKADIGKPYSHFFHNLHLSYSHRFDQSCLFEVQRSVTLASADPIPESPT